MSKLCHINVKFPARKRPCTYSISPTELQVETQWKFFLRLKSFNRQIHTLLSLHLYSFTHVNQSSFSLVAADTCKEKTLCTSKIYKCAKQDWTGHVIRKTCKICNMSWWWIIIFTPPIFMSISGYKMSLQFSWQIYARAIVDKYLFRSLS